MPAVTRSDSITKKSSTQSLQAAPSRRGECSTATRRILAAVRARLLVALLAAVSCQGCLVVSLQPVYDADTIAFEPALVGTWTSDEDHVTVTLERGEWHSYHLAFDDSGKITRLSGRLTRIGEVLLLDLTPLDGADIAPLQLPVHAVFRIVLDGDTLNIAGLDYDHFYELARAGHSETALVVDGRKNVVITAPTGDVRHWLQAHLQDAGLFSTPTTLTRKAVPQG